MYTWEIIGINLPSIIVIADCFDEALKYARSIDDNYSGGHVVDGKNMNYVY